MATANDFKVKNGLVVSTTATVLSTLTSTSTNTGALQVQGGVGIGGNLSFGGSLYLGTNVGVSGQVLKSQGPGLPATWGSSSGGSYTRITTATTLVSNTQYIVDTSIGPFTVTLPATPSTGDYITLMDGNDWATNNLTLARNGNLIENDVQDVLIDLKGIAVTAVYNGSSNGWQIVATLGARGPQGYTGSGAGITSPYSGIFTITNTTSAISTTTGALQVAGGVGVEGEIYANSMHITGDASASNNLGSLSVGSLDFNDTGILAVFQSGINSYNQVMIQNTTTGTSASSSLVVNNDQSTSASVFGEFGINSSGFSGSGSFGLPNAIYVSATGGDLVLGTTSSNAVRITPNSTDAIVISSTGTVSILTTASSISSSTGALYVAGGIGVTGSITAGGSIVDDIGNVRDMPMLTTASIYTLKIQDAGALISISSGGVIIPANVFSAGNAVTIYNNSSANQSISTGTFGGLTVWQAGTANTGTRTLAQHGIATVVAVSTNTFVISGAGLT